MQIGFCASCVQERADLVGEWQDGRLVMLCVDCRVGEIRGGRYSFDGGSHLPGPSHSYPTRRGSRSG